MMKNVARRIMGMATLAVGSTVLSMGAAQAAAPGVGDLMPAGGLPTLPASGLAEALPINGILPAPK